MSAREICRLEGIQFFFFQMAVEFLFGLVFPCDTRPIPSSGDSKHANSVCIRTRAQTHIDAHEHTGRTRTQRDTLHGNNTHNRKKTKCQDERQRPPHFLKQLLILFADDTAIISPTFKALLCFQCQNDPKYKAVEKGPEPIRNHCRTTLTLVTELKAGTEAFYGPFCLFRKKISGPENKRVIECIKSSRFNVAGQTNSCCHSQHSHLEAHRVPMFEPLLWKCIELRYFKQQKSPTVQLNIQDKTGARHLR